MERKENETDEQLLLRICRLRGVHKSLPTWHEVRLTLNALLGFDYDSEKMYSIWFKRLSSGEAVKIRGDYISTKQTESLELPKSTLDFNKDGTQKLLAYSKMSHAQSKDPNYIMEINGYPTKDWVMVNLRVNEWGSTTNLDNQYYQIRLTVKPKTIYDLNYNDIDTLTKLNVKPLDVVEYKHIDSNKTLSLMITDEHVGYGLFDEEGYKRVIERARDTAIKYGVEKIEVRNLGDFLHVDNTSETTARGTQLKLENTSPYEMWELAVSLIEYTVRRLSFLPLKFIWTQGNHSRALEYTVMNTVKKLYRNSDHIEFDVDERYRKAHNIYETFIGVFHGDMPKKNYTSWGHFEFSELWGQCAIWESYSGHFHAKDVYTEGGLQHSTLGTKKATDDYERSLGYGNWRRVVECYIYEKGQGKTHTFYF